MKHSSTLTTCRYGECEDRSIFGKDYICHCFAVNYENLKLSFFILNLDQFTFKTKGSEWQKLQSSLGPIWFESKPVWFQSVLERWYLLFVWSRLGLSMPRRIRWLDNFKMLGKNNFFKINFKTFQKVKTAA